MICIKCGKREAVFKGLCNECTWESAVVESPGSVSRIICPKCGAIKVGNAWSHNHSEAHWERKSLETFRINEPFRITGREVVGFNKRRDFIDAKITASLDGDIREFSFTIPYSEDKISCPTCNKITGSYFEAKVQIRGMTGKVTDKMVDAGKKLVEFVENNRTRDHQSFISKVEDVKDGVDIYLGKRKDGDTFAKNIKAREICSVVISNTLAGVREGKQFYRLTYMIRLFDYEPGSILFVNGRKYIFQGTNANGLNITDVEKGRDTFVNRKGLDLTKVTATGEIAEKRRFMVISRNNGETELMDRQNYSQTTIKGEITDDEVDMFILDGQLYKARGE